MTISNGRYRPTTGDKDRAEIRVEIFDSPPANKPDGIVSGEILVDGEYVAFMSSPTSRNLGVKVTTSGGSSTVTSKLRFGPRGFRSGRAGTITLTFSSATNAEVELKCNGLDIDESFTAKRKDGFFRDLTVEIDKITAASFPTNVTHNGTSWTLERIFENAGFKTSVIHSDAGVGDQQGGWSESELFDALHRLRMANRDPWHVHVLVTSRLEDSEDAKTLGWMYDVERKPHDPPREGCAIFFDAIREYVDARHGNSTAAIRNREYLITTAHEIGHTLNLVHSFDKGRADSSSLMNYPEEYDYGPDQYYTDLGMTFDDAELVHLHHHSREVTEPGYEDGTEFGADPFRRVPRAPRSHAPSSAAAKRAVAATTARQQELRASILRLVKVSLELGTTDVLTSEPLFAEVTLALGDLPNGPRRLQAAFSLNWSSGNLLFEVREPGAVWRPIRSIAIHCQRVKPRSIAAGSEARVSVPVVTTREKALFPKAGTFEIRAVVKVGYRNFFFDVPSPPVTVSVRAPQTSSEKAMVRSLKDFEVQKFIALGGWTGAPETLDAVKALGRASDRLSSGLAKLVATKHDILAGVEAAADGLGVIETINADPHKTRFLGGRAAGIRRNLQKRLPQLRLPQP